MSSRQSFLTGLFRSLDANGIPYCILRNYGDIFAESTSTDLDLIIHKRDLLRFKQTLLAAATEAKQRFVHRARYVNYSYVFWTAQSDFVRVDFETEVRWRFFPILSASAVIDSRKKHDGFYIPHPRHESIVLFTQTLWRGTLSDRYRDQLARLYAACPDKEELRRSYQDAFGAAGDALAEFHSRIATSEFGGGLCSRLRRSILLNTFTRPSALFDFTANAAFDSRRFWERLRNPAGISLVFASSSGQAKDFNGVLRKLEFLFPSQKCFLQTFDFSSHKSVAPGWEIGLKLNRLRVLFKGGLFVQFYQVNLDTDLQKIIKTHPRYLYPFRAFFCTEDSSHRICLGHVGTGFMAESTPDERGVHTEFSTLLIEFFSTVLEKERQPSPSESRKKGSFAVVIGLDGSGKTTLARNLSRLTSKEPRFDGVRYFHWRAKVFGGIEFPLPEYRDVPRKQPLAKNFVNSSLSSLRLLKNVLMANVAYHIRIRHLLRHNYLVMIDRYFYNYYLDPDSVKYTGPGWLLKSMLRWFPKPDVIVTLNAGAETLLARKQELSPDQIARQISIKDNLNFRGTPCIAVDARDSAANVAETTLAAMSKAVAKASVVVLCLSRLFLFLFPSSN